MFSQKCYLPFMLVLIVKTSNSDHIETQVLEAREIHSFRGYKDIQLFHYTVPLQVSQAVFHYKANGSIHCVPKPVAVYLQYGSFPVMDIHNAAFPEAFVIKRLFLHNITLYTDTVPTSINISNPMPGNWFAVAFVLEASSRIVQKGLFNPCSSWLMTSAKMQVFEDVKTLLSQSQTSEEIVTNQVYRLFVNEDAWLCKIKLKNGSVGSHFPVLILTQPVALPSFNYSKFINCSNIDECVIDFVPAINDWNYISIHNLHSSKIDFELHVNTETCPQEDDILYLSAINNSVSAEFVSSNSTELESPEFMCWAKFPLTRITMAVTLSYEYNLPKDEDGSYPLIINITNSAPTFTYFNVLPTSDMTGTLIVEIAISPFMNLTLNNISVIACLNYGIRPTPGIPFIANFCGDSIQMYINTTSWQNRITTVIIPFPEAGKWFISFLPQCFTIEDFSSNVSVPTIVPCELGYTSVFLRIRSAPCILGQCGDFGTCYQYVSGGFIFSTCNCLAGWKGWGCTDSSDAKTYSELLIDVLLLTISNILFIPAIVAAIYKVYYTEALVYFSTMFFSAFYHACEGVIYSYCLIKLPVLQFCDFFCAILSIWVTLVAMAGLPFQAQSVARMGGALLIALVVKYDKTSVGAVAFPTGAGSFIVLAAWGFRCYKTNKCYPKKNTWLFHILPAGILAFAGVLAFVQWETEENYPYVHSAWHCLIALSVLFALPERQVEEKDEEVSIEAEA